MANTYHYVIIRPREKNYKPVKRENMAKLPPRWFSKVKHFHLLILGALLLLGTASCQAGAEDADPGLEAAPTQATQPLPETSAPEEEGGEVAAVPEEEAVDQCLLCHTDQKTLIDTADPVVVVESESSGEG